jgi:recombinational DNA repair protein (RecF pathway)
MLQKSNILAAKAERLLTEHKHNRTLYFKLKKELERSMNEITTLAGSALRIEREL